MTSFILKIIAMVSMTLDHIGAVFPYSSPYYFRAIGRAAFPIYAFLVSEGAGRSRSRLKYIRNLAMFALISEIPFDMAFRHEINFFKDTNIFYTLFLAVSAIQVYELLKDKLKVYSSALCIIPAVAVPIIFSAAAVFLDTDYGAFGVWVIYFMYFVEEKRFKVPVLFGFFIMHYSAYIPSNPIFLLGALAGCLAASLYNGSRGAKLKWTFYIYYPLHLLILAIAREFI